MEKTVYGFVSHDDIQVLIQKRLDATVDGDKATVAKTLGDFAAVLMDINNAIPVQAKSRHVIAPYLEALAKSSEEE